MWIFLRHTGEKVVNADSKLFLFVGRDICQFLFGHISALAYQLGDTLLHLVPREQDLVIGLKMSVFTGIGNAFAVVIFIKAHSTGAAPAVFVFQKTGSFFRGVSLTVIGINAEFAVLDAGTTNQ